jgi:hypothetical protein
LRLFGARRLRVNFCNFESHRNLTMIFPIAESLKKLRHLVMKRKVFVAANHHKIQHMDRQGF